VDAAGGTERKTAMKEKRTRFWDLPETEQAKLYAVYGPQPKEGYAAHRISYVRELTSYESWFFGRGNFLSPSFLTQTLYKVKGTLSPLRLNRVFRDLDVQDDILRTNYCDLGDRVLAVVTSERKNAELIIYNNLQGHSSEELNTMMRKVGAAALRYPFNVTKGGLLRIYVFHTGKEEYAVLVTAAQIIMERFNIRALLRDALGLPEKGGYSVPPLPYTGQMEEKMREYWKKLLTPSLRGTSLPWELENVPPHNCFSCNFKNPLLFRLAFLQCLFYALCN